MAGAPRRRQGVLHHAAEGALQPEVRRLRRPSPRRQRRPAHRRQLHQRRGTGGGDDHRGAAQHALRGQLHPGRAPLRGHGRGPLPAGPGARRRLGGGADQPPGVRQGGVAVGHRVQRRGVRRVARDHQGPDRGGDRGTPARPAGQLLPGRRRAAPAAGRPGQRRAGAQPRPGPPRRRRLERPPPGWRAAASRQRPAEPRPRAGLGTDPHRGRRPAGAGAAAASHLLHLLPGRLRPGPDPVPRRRAAPHHRGRAARDPRVRRPQGRRARPRRPGRARLRRAGRVARTRRGQPPRRHAAAVQGGRRGAVRAGAGQGGVRHRDAVARHQHARPDGGDRAPVEMAG